MPVAGDPDSDRVTELAAEAYRAVANQRRLKALDA